jgi:hypothetical protein
MTVEVVDTTTGEIVPRTVPTPTRDSFAIIKDVVYLADVISDTEMVPDKLRGRPDAVAAVILYGHELGLGPMQSLNTINVIGGRPSLSPEGMRALVLSAGHGIRVSADDDAATAQCHRREWPAEEWTSHTFTMADAQRAELVNKPGSSWKKYPRAMLIARATSEACRADFSDVIRGLSYTTDEVEDMPPPPPPSPGSSSVPTAGDDPDQGGADVPPGTAELEGVLNGLAPPTRAAFRSWCRSKGWDWPPANPDQLSTMAEEVHKLLDAEAADADTYGTG